MTRVTEIEKWTIRDFIDFVWEYADLLKFNGEVEKAKEFIKFGNYLVETRKLYYGNTIKES